MVDDLSNMWMNLSLAEDESFELEAPDGEWREVASHGNLCVVGKLIADRILSKETIKNTLLKWCKMKETLSIKIFEENIFLVEFSDAGVKKRVLDSRPWVFERSLFLLENFDRLTSPFELTFDFVCFCLLKKIKLCYVVVKSELHCNYGCISWVCLTS